MLIKEIFVIIYVIVFTKAQNAITNEEAEINNLFSDSGNNLAQIDTTPKVRMRKKLKQDMETSKYPENRKKRS